MVRGQAADQQLAEGRQVWNDDRVRVLGSRVGGQDREAAAQESDLVDAAVVANMDGDVLGADVWDTLRDRD